MAQFSLNKIVGNKQHIIFDVLDNIGLRRNGNKLYINNADDNKDIFCLNEHLDNDTMLYITQHIGGCQFCGHREIQVNDHIVIFFTIIYIGNGTASNQYHSIMVKVDVSNDFSVELKDVWFDVKLYHYEEFGNVLICYRYDEQMMSNRLMYLFDQRTGRRIGYEYCALYGMYKNDDLYIGVECNNHRRDVQIINRDGDIIDFTPIVTQCKIQRLENIMTHFIFRGRRAYIVLKDTSDWKGVIVKIEGKSVEAVMIQQLHTLCFWSGYGVFDTYTNYHSYMPIRSLDQKTNYWVDDNFRIIYASDANIAQLGHNGLFDEYLQNTLLGHNVYASGTDMEGFIQSQTHNWF